MLGHRRRSVRAFSDSYLVIKDRAVKQGVDSLNQFILIVLEIPSRIAPGLFDVTQETARYVAVGIPAKVNSTESLTAKKINRKMHTYRSCQETWRTCWSLFLPAPSSHEVVSQCAVHSLFLFTLCIFSQMRSPWFQPRWQ